MSEDELPEDPFSETIIITITRDITTGDVECDWDKQTWSTDAILATLALAQHVVAEFYWEVGDEGEEDDDEYAEDDDE